jgi:hypothetical protein
MRFGGAGTVATDRVEVCGCRDQVAALKERSGLLE